MQHLEFRRLHPYFGHVLTNANNYGFHTHYSYPYQKKKDDFVVGIFGGSTAMHWADYLDETNAWNHLRIKKRPGTHIVVLNFAISGMHEPQQLAVASKFLEGVDLAILYDGWNEALTDNCPWGPPELPQDYALLFQRETNVEALAALRSSTEHFRGVSQMLQRFPLNQSYAAHLYWVGTQKNVRLEQSQFSSRAFEAGKKQTVNFEAECKTPQDDRVFQNWKKYTLQFMALGNYLKVPTYHFLQPNPYIPNAKPLEKDERTLTNWENQRAGGHGREGDAAVAFRERYLKQPVPHGTDLSYLFKDETRATYIDPYTHLNQLGNELLSEAIERKLRQEKVLE